MYNRFNFTYEQAQPVLAEVERYLSAHAAKVIEADNAFLDSHNIYIIHNLKALPMKKELGYQMKTLFYAGWIEEVPWTPTESALFVHKQGHSNGTMTLSKSHVRLPQLSHLITLTPKHFIQFFEMLAGQRDLLYFELEEADIPAQFQFWFSKYYKGQRINSKIADKKWVPRYVIDTIAALEPTKEMQLAAMQYITVMRDETLVAIPSDTVIDLELDWKQIKDEDDNDTDYCITEPDNTSFVLMNKVKTRWG